MTRKLFSSHILLLVLAGALIPCAIAQNAPDPAKEAKAEELFTLMHMDRTYGQLMSQLTEQTDQMLKQMLPEEAMTGEQAKQLDAFRAKVNAMVVQQMSWDALKPDYVRLYADTYSAAELDGIIAFYHSPAGQAMLDKTPELMKASSSIAMSHMGQVEPKLRQMIDEFDKQIKASPGPVSGPGPGKDQ